MKSKLPFELPSEEEDNFPSPVQVDHSSQGTIRLSREELSHMEETYRQEVQDYQSLLAV